MSEISQFTFQQDTWNGSTKGSFQTELEAEDFLCNSAAVNTWFSVYRQVRAKPLFSHPSKSSVTEKYRFDVLLLPSSEIVAAGWKSGAVVIEVKKSGVKLGPCYSQAFDYVNSCAVGLSMLGGVLIIPSYCFVFPSRTDGGPVASLQTQNRFGCAFVDDYGKWEFYSGHTMVCRFDEQTFEVGKQDAGNKTGSR